MNESQQDLEYFLSSRFATHRYPVNTATIITLYSTVALFGFIENAIIFGTLLAIGDLRSTCNGGQTANIFVGALAVSDMILCVFNVPTQLYYELGEPSGMSQLTCRLFFASLGVPTHVSCILILLIAIDRYRNVLFPGQPRKLTTRGALVLILLSIVFSALAAFPVAYYTGVQEAATNLFEQAASEENATAATTTTITEASAEDRHFPMYCVEQWPSPTRRLIYSIFVVIGQFLTPLIVTLILYAHIGCWLSKRRGMIHRASTMDKTADSELSPFSAPSSRQKPLQLAARLEAKTKRTHRILVGIVTCFAGCWTPWTLYSLYLECTAYAMTMTASPGQSQDSITDAGARNMAVDVNLKITDLVLKLFALSSTCANPFLYGWLNENIRGSIIRRLGVCVKSQRQATQTNITTTNANFLHYDNPRANGSPNFDSAKTPAPFS
uniref:G_PROTEIN_RECEP_F1_2 domain-containing protein n=1 Tax=Mesocestoides corti TaxID=53468 RepID=A0A5K3FP54_MESCO